MRNSIIGKLQLLISAAAVVIIAALSFTPILKLGLESNLTIYENSLDTVIDLAWEKEADILEEEYLNLPKEEQEARRDEFTAKMEDIMKRYRDMSLEIAGMNKDGEKKNIETTLSLSVIDMAKSAKDTAKLVEYWLKAVTIDTTYELAYKEGGEGIDEEAAKRYVELRDELAEEIDPSAVNETSVRTFRLFFNGFLSSINLAEMDDDAAFKLASISILVAFKLIILVAVFVLFPLSMALSVIGLVLGIFSRKKYKKVQKKCKRAIVWIATLLLAVVICGAELTWSGTIIILAAAAAVVINLLASRVKSYTEHEKKFLNVMQLSAIVSTVGIAIFAIYLAKADLLSFYTSAELAEQVSAGKETVKEMAMSLGILAGMGALTIVVLQRVFKGAMKLITRAACMGGGGGSGFGTAVAGAVLLVANYFVMKMLDVSLKSSMSEAMTMAGIGVAVALGGAVLFRVLGVVFAHGTTREEKRAVMSGTSINDKKD